MTYIIPRKTNFTVKSFALLFILIALELFSYATMEDINKEPINYNLAPVNDPVFRLIK